MMSTARALPLFLLSILFVASHGTTVFDIVELGAKPDGLTNSSPGFQSAWRAACDSVEPAIIYVPQETFLLNHSLFKGPCKNGFILMKIDGSIVAPSDYNDMKIFRSWIRFQDVHEISIQGGLFDGRGTDLWECKARTAHGCPPGARTIAIHKSSNVNISGLTSKDSQRFHIEIYQSQNINLDGITVSASGESPNTDGIHIERSNGVKILNSNISTGDDCISIGPGTKNLWIENINCGPGHGISIGSLGWKFQEDGVENVTVKSISFTNAQNGLRIKTWARPSNSSVRGIVFHNVTMDNVKHPIIIDQNYCPRHKACPHKASGVKISDVNFFGIHGTSASKVAVKFDCSTKNPCTDISLEDINLTYKNEVAEAWCENAWGKTSGLVDPKGCFLE